MFRKAAVFLTHSYCRDLHNILASYGYFSRNIFSSLLLSIMFLPEVQRKQEQEMPWEQISL